MLTITISKSLCTSACLLAVAGGTMVASRVWARFHIDDPAVLSGPKVGDAAVGTLSLVEKDFDGKIKMLEVRPEVAGLKLLKLSDAEKAATDKILQEREAMVAKVLKEAKVRTPDLGGKSTTTQMADAVLAAL